MATQIQLRRGTAAAWTSADPTLAVGELGIETDTNKFKIGDGATAWTGLAYATIAPATHATSHKNGGSDEIATATPAANAIPKADGSSKLDGWITADAAAETASLRKLGTGATDACAGNDGRLSDARTPTAHATSHKNGGADEIATATAAANAIPKADANGKLASGWGGSASTLATLNGSSKVVEDPANATATPTASKIPIADGSGKVDGWVTANAAAGTASLRQLGTGSTDACAGNDARLSDDRTASGIKTATTTVAVSGAAAPSSGQVLTATSSTAAQWSTPSGGAQKAMTVDITYDTLRWLETNAVAYTLAADFIFRGTSVMGTPSAVKALAWGTAGAPNAVAGVRLYDLTHSQTICENLNITNTEKAIVDLGSMANWPAGESILEVHIYRVSGAAATRAVISGIQIQF